ncbi:tetratricopeptide repeat protein 21B-like isoform X1 [Crassostrea angulata]|uniref:tetratricopeptide repeat protein 21B-like isoform X1 n=1 Tax=Magallana angulata TaxID=2784310 RepID=UPI0022B20BB3|nr:tetratricopeptide repeat protein 21B-like isoform X1 [Crassostrea angulata]
MVDTDPTIIGKISYYCREKYYCHMENAATEGLQKFSNDPVLKFFRAYAVILQGRIQEGIRELDVLKDKRDVNICSTMALMFAHKHSQSVDREAVQELDAKLKEERKQSGEMGLYYGGLFLLLNDKPDKAREYIDRMLKMATTKEGFVAKGWIELESGREAKKAIKYFDDAIGMEGARDINALLGKAKYLESRHNFTGALEQINQLIVTYPGFLPALIEKMKLQLNLQDWDQAIETAQRALDTDLHCTEALKYQVIYLLSREGNYSEASGKIGDLISALDRFEPRSSYLYYHMAQIFSRICGRNALVLQQTYTLVERSVQQDSENTEYINELGFQLLLQGKVKDAMKCYRNAMKINDTSVQSLTGIIRCQLIENQLDDAAQQLDFLQEVQQSIGRTSELAYLSAALSIKRGEGPDKAYKLLNEAVEIHFTALKGNPLGPQYYLLLNPDFLLQMLKDFLVFAPTQPIKQGQPPDPLLKRCCQVLEALTRTVPGLLEALYLMAKVRFLQGDIDSAQGTLNHCLEMENTYSDAHILMAQIHLYQNNFKLANQSLEVGLSYNFEVRDHPLYHLIKARILKKSGDSAEAVKTLQMAMTLPGVKAAGKGPMAKKGKVPDIGTNDRVSVFLELAEAHTALGETHEAAKVMQDAINEFSGTAEEIRITIANADLSIARGDVEMAVTMLRNITTDQTYYVKSREKLADIYLHHKKDKRLYTGCYRELYDKQPNVETALLLGDAYMSIQEPDKAIEVYEKAMKNNPKETQLASKIGQALVKTHNYGKAINYYEAALKNGSSQGFLRHDLAELLLKLRQYDKAEKVLKQSLEAESASDLDTMMEHTKLMVLLAKVYQKVDRMEDAMTALTKARDMQARVLKRVQIEQPDAVGQQKQLASDICVTMAEQVKGQRDYEKAIKFYKEALVYNENDSKVMLDLAGLYLMTEDLDSCQHQLMSLLKNEKENDAATIMLADLMFRKNEYDSAVHHFQQLLTVKPDNYEALAGLVDLMRRSGKLEEVPKFLEAAESATGRASMEGGFNYCKGLYEWYTGNPTAALKLFNKARKDSDWGNLSIYNMIEICLNPDNDTLGGEVFEDEGTGAVDRDKMESEQVAVRTAEKLLKEVKAKPGDLRPKMLENMALIASKQKQNVEKAVNNLMEVSANEHDSEIPGSGSAREHVGALYGIAAAYMVLKQTPRARNQLKRIAKNNWTMQDAEDLEKGWLLLADIYIQTGKYDMATELLKRCLQHNRSCCKAHEYLGYIFEKEQSYKDAASSYEMAWKYGNKNNPVIGFKLAFNYLKAKRFVDAIDICHHVLGNHPNYPKIRKEILEKARASLRV